MFVKYVTMDDTKTWNSEEYVDEQVTSELVERLIRTLDGGQHSLLTLGAEDEIHHMAIGGDARVGLVVYHTSDNVEFHNLLSNQPDNYDTVLMVVGGQPSDIKHRYLVEVDRVVVAAKEFIVSGLLAEQLDWEFESGRLQSRC
jgi:Immunity protein Imm1